MVQRCRSTDAEIARDHPVRSAELSARIEAWFKSALAIDPPTQNFSSKIRQPNATDFFNYENPELFGATHYKKEGYPRRTGCQPVRNGGQAGSLSYEGRHSTTARLNAHGSGTMTYDSGRDDLVPQIARPVNPLQ